MSKVLFSAKKYSPNAHGRPSARTLTHAGNVTGNMRRETLSAHNAHRNRETEASHESHYQHITDDDGGDGDDCECE